MPMLVLILIALLFLCVLVEGLAIFGLFRQVGLLYGASAGGDPKAGSNLPKPAARPAVDPLPAGTSLPDLVGVSVQGTAVSLATLIGQRTLLVFLNPLCEPCNVIGPEIEALHRDADLNTRVVVVVEGDRLSAEEYVVEHKLTAPVLYELPDEATRRAPVLARFQVPMIPFAYLLDEQHHIVTNGTVGAKEFFWRVAKGLPEVPMWRTASQPDTGVPVARAPHGTAVSRD